MFNRSRAVHYPKSLICDNAVCPFGQTGKPNGLTALACTSETGAFLRREACRPEQKCLPCRFAARKFAEFQANLEGVVSAGELAPPSDSNYYCETTLIRERKAQKVNLKQNQRDV
jgi:hypothetical protein